MEYIIDERYDGVRLDRFLRKMLPNTPLTEIFKGLRVGNIKLNGKKAKENARIEKGDIIKIFKLPGASIEEKENQVELKNKFINLSEKDLEVIKKGIIFENDNLVIFNKPFGLVMHAGSSHDYGLNEMLMSYYKNPDLAFVNRIDKETSGMVIAAKTLPCARELSEEIRENRVDKRYYILVDGVIKTKNFTRVSFLKKTETEVVELQAYEKGAKESITHFEVVSASNSNTLLIGQLDSGRTHQLRVQLSSMGNPIVGDKKYNPKTKCKRMLLHSYYLEIKKYNLKFELPIPDEFKPR
ncbi:MAG: RluA family pseudouridine synthase [Fusobacteriaceae bacterium]